MCKAACRLESCGQPPPGSDHSPAEAEGAELENVAVPVVVMLKCPDQHIQVPGVDGLAEQKAIADEIVEVLLVHVFSVTEVDPHLEKIKGLARTYLEWVSIIQVHVEYGAGAARPEPHPVIEPMRPGGQRNIERFFLVNLRGGDPRQFSLQEPAEGPAGTQDRGRQFPEKPVGAGRSVIQDIRTQAVKDLSEQGAAALSC